MAAQKLYVRVFVLFMCQIVSTQVTIIGNSTDTNCESSSNSDTIFTNPAFRCANNASQTNNECQTFAILRANPRFSSLSNLSLFLGISRSVITATNGFSVKTELLPKNEPFLIPIRCECDGSSSLFRSQFITTAKGESFSEISQCLEGLTTCKAIKEKNPNVLSKNSSSLVIPIQCACSSSRSGLVLTYPVAQGDTIAGLAKKFNTTQEAIVSANRGSVKSGLKSFTSLLVPVNAKPALTHFPVGPVVKKRKKKNMRRIGIYIVLAGIFVGVTITVAAAFILIQMKKKQSQICKGGHGNVRDLELQQLSLSVRTASDKKVSFDGSNLDAAATPRGRAALESYTEEELNKATEDFSSSNHIEGSVYHGRLNGKNLAIKRVKQNIISELDLDIVNNAVHRHPNIITLVGTHLGEEEAKDSYLVFEYAKNGSLKDWLHGGLAMKNQFIASCFCFLTWSQRLRICLDLATALNYMHHVIEPRYVHGNVKSRNVFLDEEFRAKLGNFGLSKRDDCEVGADIFAFGVVILEVLSGRTPISGPEEKGGAGVRLVESVRTVLASGDSEEMRRWMDGALGESYSFDGAVQLANLARTCTEDDVALRPTTEEAVRKLTGLVEESPPHAGECSLLVSESSSKPLVKSVANDSM